MKNKGYISKYRFSSHQVMSKSNLSTQNDIAIKPEVNVSTNDIRLVFFQSWFFFLYKKILSSPVTEINISSGKNDQFHATIIGFV